MYNSKIIKHKNSLKVVLGEPGYGMGGVVMGFPRSFLRSTAFQASSTPERNQTAQMHHGEAFARGVQQSIRYLARRADRDNCNTLRFQQLPRIREFDSLEMTLHAALPRGTSVIGRGCVLEPGGMVARSRRKVVIGRGI